MSPRDGLVVVVPESFPMSQVPQVVERHAPWIERARARTADRRERLQERDGAAPPTQVVMPGIGVAWEVRLRPSDAPGVRARVADGRLTLSGAVHDRAACRAAMQRALLAAAKDALPRMLLQVEAATGWHAQRVVVRRQRSRWGSCSARGTVSLNASLAFLPPQLVRHVLVHELAHTRRLDHSPVFWALVERHDPLWRVHRAELREAWRHVPVWADESR